LGAHAAAGIIGRIAPAYNARHRSRTIMLTLIAKSLARLLPHSLAALPPSPRADDEQWQRASGWHASSWELTHGLDVIEMTLAQQEYLLAHAFVDTQPTFHEPEVPRLAA
jgi:hypothetical protein